MKWKSMKTYRVFVTRHYIAVDYFDIEATKPLTARNAAVKAAYKLRFDPRSEATDNTWLADEPVEISKLGDSISPFEVVEVLRTKSANVYRRK